MHDNEALILARISRFAAERITPAIHSARQALSMTAWQAPGEPVPFAEAVGQTYNPISPGTLWGPPWSTMWLHVTGQTPASWLDDGEVRANDSLEVVADLGFRPTTPGFQAEGMYYSSAGVILKAAQPRNQWVRVRPGVIDLYIEAAANPEIQNNSDTPFAPTDLGDVLTAPTSPCYRLGGVDLVLRDRTVWELAQDITALHGLLLELPADSTRRACLLRAFERLIDVVDPADVAGTAARGREVLAPELAKPAHASAHRVFAVGHAHIDSAWLWPLRETRRKVARTFSNQLALMADNPDFVFASSSAQQYAWIEQDQPELFERIRAKVADGQFVPMGSMWVESDTNLPGGEAMARQFVAGKRYFMSRFGVDTKEVWLPDSFGYSGALPQIARLAGCDWFLSQKLSWNETDAMPHHTFQWKGIDGTRLLTHFPPADTYNSDLSAHDLLHAARNFRDKGVASASIVPFGWGDGGGGPTREMVASARRFADTEGAPTVRLASPADFFRDAATDYPNPPVWRGEMYLEFHRGTYTSQAKTKQGNRRNEHLLREAELWATTAAVRCGTEYPYDELDDIWNSVLLHQFHDILPGSAIGWVHREAEATHARLSAQLEQVIDDAAGQLIGEGETELMLNALPYDDQEVPALGIGPVSRGSAARPSSTNTPTGTTIDNGLIRLHLTPEGLIDSLYDHTADRELVPPGQTANLLQLHRNAPRHWDAWDIEEGYQRIHQDLTSASSFTLDTTEDAVIARIVRQFGESTIAQEITVRAGSPVIGIVNDIDWRERQKLLKLAFPCALVADRSAAETQFGHVWRPTHTNTSWDWAKFEIPAHRWVRVNEGDYGVAVANSCTYGHDITAQTDADGHPYTLIRLSLLHSPLFPDPRADHGHYRIAVTLHPGTSLRDAVEDGYAINLPTRVRRGAHGVEPLIAVGGESVVVEAVKLADDRSGDVVVRLYEALGGRGRATVRPLFDHTAICPVDLLERTPEEGGVTLAGDNVTIVEDDLGGNVRLNLHPFQIVTLRISRQGTDDQPCAAV